MGVTVKLYTYYGVEAPRKAFWVGVGFKRVCVKDLSHGITESAKFCPECGVGIKDLAIEEPSPRFAELCEKSGIAPAQFFNLLLSDESNGWEWVDDGAEGSGRSFKLFWLNVAAIDGERTPERMALGFKLAHADPYDRNVSPVRVVAASWSEMEIYDRAMREVAKIFDLAGEPKLYAQVYYG